MSKDRGGVKKDGKEKKDQLTVILDVLGTPTEDELRRLRTDEARAYIRSLPGHASRKAPEDLSRRYPTAGPEALDLLRRLLRLNVEDRISLQDAIRHPFLSSVRVPAQEAGRDAPIIVRKATPATIRDLFIEEIRHFNPHIPDTWAEILAVRTRGLFCAQKTLRGTHPTNLNPTPPDDPSLAILTAPRAGLARRHGLVPCRTCCNIVDLCNPTVCFLGQNEVRVVARRVHRRCGREALALEPRGRI